MHATITINVSVHDKQELYEHAKRRYAEENSYATDPGADADSYLLCGGEIDVSACLVMLFDPGTSPDGSQIEDSSVELHPEEDE